MEDVQKEREALLTWIASLENDQAISALREVQQSFQESTDWYDHLDRAEKASIEAGLKDFEEGNTHSHASVRSRYAKYL